MGTKVLVPVVLGTRESGEREGIAEEKQKQKKKKEEEDTLKRAWTWKV